MVKDAGIRGSEPEAEEKHALVFLCVPFFSPTGKDFTLLTQIERLVLLCFLDSCASGICSFPFSMQEFLSYFYLPIFSFFMPVLFSLENC